MYETIGWLGFMWAVLFFAHLTMEWAARKMDEPEELPEWTTQDVLEREG